MTKLQLAYGPHNPNRATRTIARQPRRNGRVRPVRRYGVIPQASVRSPEWLPIPTGGRQRAVLSTGE
jgi:hypothetical protein